MEGNANPRSTWSESSTTDDQRGMVLAGALVEMGLHLLNEGNVPTFYTVRRRKVYQSHVDITTCTAGLLGAIDKIGKLTKVSTKLKFINY